MLHPFFVLAFVLQVKKEGVFYKMLELAGIIVLGILAQWIAWKLRVPAILPLILIGLLVGPFSTFWSEDGNKWIEPRFNGSEGFFPGETLFYFISLGIGIILFEGGLTLRTKELKGVGSAILRLITVGSMVTFIGAGIVSHFLIGLEWEIAFLFAALIIVTGPTVIAPILRNVPLKHNVATVLKWEGILIDPIGALVAVLMFEFIITGQGGGAFTLHALGQFGKILLIGLLIGGSTAWLLYQFIKRDWIPQYLLNVVTLAMVLVVFVLSDMLASESGLLSVVVMGMVLGNLDTPKLKSILDFKESLSVLLISILFILLSANINMDDLWLIFNWPSFFLFLFVVLILRPVSVFLSTLKSGLAFREKLYIGWLGPRGIVAAGIASLFGITLTREGVPDAEYITPLVFLIVLGTVILTALSARVIARSLDVMLTESKGILIIGAHKAARLIAQYLHNNDRHVVVVDNNPNNIGKAKALGIEAFQANIYTDELSEYFELLDVGYLMALTSSPEVNSYACSKLGKDFGELGTFRLISPEELHAGVSELPEEGLFSATDDFINISEVARDYPEIHEWEVSTKEQFIHGLGQITSMSECVPLFLKEPSGNLEIIPARHDQLEIEPNSSIVYMGKKVPVPEPEMEDQD